MKKLLRNLSIAAVAVMPALQANAEIQLTENWAITSTIIGDTWKNADNPGNNVRYIAAKDGKLYGIAMDQKAIMSFDNTSAQPTLVKALTLPEGVKLPGSALAFDQAGNLVFNYNFVQTNPSPSQAWGLYNPTTGEVSNYTIPADQLPVQRIDHIGRIIGDATSAEGAYCFAFGQTYKFALMYHFTGDGSKMTKVTVTPAVAANGVAVDGYALSSNGWAQPAYETTAEFAASTKPELAFFCNTTQNMISSMVGGTQVNYTDGACYQGSYNRGFATFVLGDKRYFVSGVKGNNHELTITPNFQVFDEEGNVYATCTASDWTSYQTGYSQVIVEPVNDYTVNIYGYAAASKGSGAVMCTLVDTDIKDAPVVNLQGKGTAAEPYIIATAQDLCNAWTGHKAGATVYYKQTADIDMKGVTEYHAIAGFNGVYDCSINYDGGYHVIRNFAPTDREAIDNDPVLGNNYYCTTIFGLITGEVKNLGAIDADCHAFASAEVMGCGILGAYVGHHNTPEKNATITNCFVTGKAKSDASYCGGMFGTTGGTFSVDNPANNKITITDSYSNVTVEGTLAGGIIGRMRNATEMTNVYTKATVTGADAALIATTDKENIPLTVNNVLVAGNDNDVVLGNGIVASKEIEAEPLEDVIAMVQEWSAYNEKKMLNNLPTLNWMTDAQIAAVDEVAVDNDNAPVEYYNLQGVRVENPANGLYIKRQGTKATKVIL